MHTIKKNFMRMMNFVEKIKTIITRKSLANSLRQVTFFSGVGFLAQIIMMIYTILVARALGPNQLGVYSGLYAITGVSITFVNFGLDLWMLKEAHHYDSIQIITGKIITIKLVLGFFWGIICLIFLPLTQSQFFTHTLVLLAVGDVICDILFNTITTSWTIQRKIKQLNIMLLFSRAGKLVLLLVLIALINLSPVTVISSRFLISFFTLLISLLILKPIMPKGKIKELFTIVKESSAFGFSEILAMIYANIDVVILTFFSISDTGLYSPASGIIHALFIIPNSFYVYLLPKYSKQVSGDKETNLRKLTRNVLLIFSLIGLVLSLGLLISGKMMITLILGDKYLVTGDLIRILSPIMLFKSIAFGLALVIVITGKQKKRLLPQMIVSVLNITFNILLLPYFGLFSVAWIYTSCELILMLGYLLIVLMVIKNGKIRKTAS